MSRRDSKTRLQLKILLAAATIAVALLTLLMSACGGGGDGGAGDATPTPDGDLVNIGLLTPIVQPTLSPEEVARQRGGAITGEFKGNRLVIPSIGVNAPFSKKAVGSDGVMPNPDGPEDSAYYDFSAWPGLGGVPGIGGNSVFSGHVDYHDYGPAVFWRLRELAPGDIIEIHMTDGVVLKYAVEWNRVVTPETVVWDEVLASTAEESMSLITCAGTFDSGSRQYDQRQLVWAKRVS